MNRLEAVNKFYEEHPIDPPYGLGEGRKPPFVYGHAHVVIEDDNLDDYWIYSAIGAVALSLAEVDGDYTLYGLGTPKDQAIILLKFLVSLLDLPLPDWWEEDNE